MAKTKTSFTASDVRHIATLATIPVTQDEEKKLAEGFNSVLAVIDQLNTADTQAVEPTHQVTGLSNVFREDTVDSTRTFTQDEALANAKNTHKGFFMVEQVLEGD